MSLALMVAHDVLPTVDLLILSMLFLLMLPFQLVTGVPPLSSNALEGADVAIITTCHTDWDDHKLPLWSKRVIAALPEEHPLAEKSVLQWTDLACKPLLVQQCGAGPEMQRLLAIKFDPLGAQHFLHEDVSVDRLLGLVGAGCGTLLALEGATGATYPGVVFPEVHDDQGPTCLNFRAYWRETNANPSLRSFLDMLRERYPSLSADSDPS